MNTDNGALRQMENEDENLENTFEKCVTNVKIQDLTSPINCLSQFQTIKKYDQFYKCFKR